jgi:hypothetical protein
MPTASRLSLPTGATLADRPGTPGVCSAPPSDAATTLANGRCGPRDRRDLYAIALNGPVDQTGQAIP